MKYFFIVLATIFFITSCDSSSIKTTKPKNDGDAISQTDDDKTDSDNEVPDENIKTVCGDGKVEGKEVCEIDTMINCIDINSDLYEGGKAKCLEDCTGWDIETCTLVPMECGNKIIEGTEVCEREDLINCVDIDSSVYESGKAKCFNNCKGWDIETCVEKEVPDDDGDPVCVDECLVINSVTCLGSKVMKCTAGTCNKWIENKDCDSTGQFCVDGNSIGFGTESNQREKVYKGTFIEATSNATVFEYSMDLDNETGQPLVFAIYVSDTSDGDYTILSTRVVDNPGTGRKMYRSGPMKTSEGTNVPVTAGKFYIFGVAWSDNMTSYFKSFGTYAPDTVSFGTTLGGTAITDSYPLLSTISGVSKGLTTYNTTFDTGSTSTDICVCSDKCPAKDDTRCNSNWVEECRADTYGCLDWYQDTDCDYLTCELNNGTAECVNNCVSECTLNYKQCDGNTVQKCTTGVDGCTDWTTETDCSMSLSQPYCGADGANSAKCYPTPQASQEYIAAEATDSNFSTTSATGFRGMYVQSDKNAVITAFKIHLQQPEGATGIDVPFLVYEGSALTGSFTRVHRSVYTVGANGYYGPTSINVSVTAGKYYLIGFFLPINTGYYFVSGGSFATQYPLKFGKSVGNENFTTSTEPSAAYTFDGPSYNSYRMYITSYLN